MLKNSYNYTAHLLFITTAPSSDKNICYESIIHIKHCLWEIWGVLGNTLGLQKWNSFLQGYLVVMCPRQKKHTMLYGAATGPSGKINRNRHNVLDRLSARFWWFLLILFFFCELWNMNHEGTLLFHMGLVVVKNYFILITVL